MVHKGVHWTDPELCRVLLLQDWGGVKGDGRKGTLNEKGPLAEEKRVTSQMGICITGGWEKKDASQKGRKNQGR